MEQSVARIVSLQVSPGGVPKLPVERARVTPLGLEGDAHRDLKHHGGPDKALCLYALERIDALRAEGHPILPGATGENVTIRGLDWPTVVPGTRFRLGDEVVIEVTQYTTPCANIAPAFRDGDYGRISHKTHPGDSRVYARVLQTGSITVGDPVTPLGDA